MALVDEQLYTLGNSIYFLSDEGTWGEAQAIAQSFEGNLVTINNEQEQIFLAGLFQGATPWLGYSDSATEGTFRWIGDQSSNYENWEGNEPNNFRDEDVVAIGDEGGWFDVDANGNRRGIVEITNPVTPIFIIEDLGIIEPFSGSKQAQFKVKRYGNTDSIVTIGYNTADDTARAGSEYESATGQITFNRGETEKTIPITVFSDDDDTNNDLFFVNLTSITAGAVLGDNQAVGTLRENNDIVTFDGKTYLLTNAKIWGEAQVEARTYGGNLVTIDNPAEQIFLGGAFDDSTPWIGYSDSASENQFEWVVDENSAYTNWNASEPGNFRNEDFVAIGDEGDWFDVDGSDDRRGIVEIPEQLSIPLSDLTTEKIFTLGENIYLLTPDATNWGLAQNKAQTYQGNLVTINSPEEQVFLAGLYDNSTPWIGYSDAQQEGSFTWFSGNSNYEDQWAVNEPNNFRNEDFVAIGDEGSWFDVDGSENRRGIVEISNPDIPIFVIEDLGIIEPFTGRQQVFFKVKRYGNTDPSVTIGYNTADNTATANNEYDPVSGQITFNQGETEKTIAVTVFSDNDDTNNDQFFLNLTSITPGAVLGDNQAVGTIRERDDVFTFNGKTYLLTNEAGTWGEAQAEALTYGGNLVTINNEAEQNFLAGTFASASPWIGLSDAGEEGRFRWITDNTAYTNWNGNEPNNFRNEDFVAMARNGSWSDVDGSEDRRGIIELVTPPQPEPDLTTVLNRFQNRERPGTYLFATEGESVNIRANFPNFIEEGRAFSVASQPGDNLVQFNRFQNSLVPGTYLYATEGESISIRENFTNFIEEGIAFYAYGAGSGRGIEYYRMQNTQQAGTYIFVNATERDQILASFPQFALEGAAFEVEAA